MEASRITIDPDTRKAARPMTRHGRTKLRRQIVVDYIKAKPYGKRIKLAEFQRICQFKNSGNTQAFINRMIRDHVIERHNIGLKTYFYTADGKIKTKKLINPAPPPRLVWTFRQSSGWLWNIVGPITNPIMICANSLSLLKRGSHEKIKANC